MVTDNVMKNFILFFCATVNAGLKIMQRFENPKISSEVFVADN